MTNHLENLETMMLIWNTPDPETRERLAEEALEHNVHFADPNHNIVGRKAFLKMVAQTLEQLPGARYARNSEVDTQNNFCRYHWKIDIGEKRVMNGFDMTEVNDAGKVVKVIGFFGSLDAAS